MANQKGYSYRKRNESSYEVIVYLSGKPYYTTYHPPKDKKLSASKLEQEIRNHALAFAENLKQGYTPNKWKFAEYAEYVLSNMLATGASKTTVSDYRSLLKRTNKYLGNMYLTDITPQVLNHMYQSLAKETKQIVTAVATPRLEEVRKEKGITYKQIHDQGNVAKNTASIACRGKSNVSLETAQKVAVVLGENIQDIFIIQKSTEKLSQRTLSSHAALIGVILDNAEKELLVKYNAYSKSRAPKRITKEANFFETDEIIKILNCVHKEPLKWQLIIHLLIITGGRRGEIAGLKWDCIDWNNNQIKIDKALLYNGHDGTYEHTTKTSSGNRIIPLPEQTMQLLHKYKQWYQELKLLNGDRWHETGYLFVQGNGLPMNPTSITSYCRKLGNKYGIDSCHPHKFRHSYASTLIMNNLDDVSLAKALGHSRPSTTKNIYGHVMEQANQKSADIIANAYLRNA